MTFSLVLGDLRAASVLPLIVICVVTSHFTYSNYDLLADKINLEALCEVVPSGFNFLVHTLNHSGKLVWLYLFICFFCLLSPHRSKNIFVVTAYACLDTPSI